jgi:dihydrofolate synthase/folylpolyglutamate synthase
LGAGRARPDRWSTLAQAAARAGAPLWRPGRDYRFESREGHPFCYRGPGWTVRPAALGLVGHHQRHNAALACALLEAAAGRGLRVGPAHAESGLALARWPGRLQRIASSPEVWLDGAHNPHAAKALARALPALCAGRRLQLVFGALGDKDLAGLLGPLLPLAAHVHLCAPRSERAAPPARLAEVASALAPGLPFTICPSPREAFSQARRAAGATGIVLGTGSLYLVGELLDACEGRPDAAMPTEHLMPARSDADVGPVASR